MILDFSKNKNYLIYYVNNVDYFIDENLIRSETEMILPIVVFTKPYLLPEANFQIKTIKANQKYKYEC